MKVIEFKEVKNEEIQKFNLKSGHLNLILCDKKGVLTLPQCKKLTFVEILFALPCHFIIQTEDNKKLSIGAKYYSQMETMPGEKGFDCNPRFVFVPDLDSWLIITQGNIIVPSDEIELVAEPVET